MILTKEFALCQHRPQCCLAGLKDSGGFLFSAGFWVATLFSRKDWTVGFYIIAINHWEQGKSIPFETFVCVCRSMNIFIFVPVLRHKTVFFRLSLSYIITLDVTSSSISIVTELRACYVLLHDLEPLPFIFCIGLRENAKPKKKNAKKDLFWYTELIPFHYMFFTEP